MSLNGVGWGGGLKERGGTYYKKIKVLCEQNRELIDDLHDFWIIFNVIWFREFCG